MPYALALAPIPPAAGVKQLPSKAISVARTSASAIRFSEAHAPAVANNLQLAGLHFDAGSVAVVHGADHIVAGPCTIIPEGMCKRPCLSALIITKINKKKKKIQKKKIDVQKRIDWRTRELNRAIA